MGLCSCVATDLFELRLNCLETLDDCLLMCGDFWSSIGGVGKPDILIQIRNDCVVFKQTEVRGSQRNYNKSSKSTGCALII
jgi:hypothetical protein